MTKEEAKELFEGWVKPIKLRRAIRRKLQESEDEIIEYIEDGDLYFDKENNIVLKLISPITLINQKVLEQITLKYRAFTLDELGKISKRTKADGMNSLTELMVKYIKEIDSVIEVGMLDSQDFSVVSLIMGFFSAR